MRGQTFIDWQGVERADEFQYCYECGSRIFGPFDRVEDCAKQAAEYIAACYRSDTSTMPTPPTVTIRPMRIAGKAAQPFLNRGEQNYGYRGQVPDVRGTIVQDGGIPI